MVHFIVLMSNTPNLVLVNTYPIIRQMVLGEGGVTLLKIYFKIINIIFKK